MIDLGPFLQSSLGRNRESGVWDCATFPAAWVRANGFVDPFNPWRGEYADEADALAIISATPGGLVELFERALVTVGLSRKASGDCAAGDVAVVSVLGHCAGAVYAGERFALVGERGLVFVPLASHHVRAVWGFA